MDAPMCTFCEHRHYSTQPHVWPKELATAKSAVVNKLDMVANRDNGSLQVVANTVKMIANKETRQSRHGKYSDLDKRRQYMRDYMRNKRNA